MATEPASNGADDLTDSSTNSAASESDGLNQQEPQVSPARLWNAAAGASERDRLRSPQVALNRGINAFNAFNRAEEEAVSIQNKPPEAYLDRGYSAERYSTQPPSQPPSQPELPYSRTAQPAPNISRQDSIRQYSSGSVPAPKKRHRWFGLLKKRPAEKLPAENYPPGHPAFDPATFSPEAALNPALANPEIAETGQYIINPLDGSAIFVPAQPQPESWWEKQPYYAIAHILAIGGTLTAAWLFGILAAQVLPGSFDQPPLQESVLRKSSRLTRRLWNVSQLWHTPTAETRIEAIPLPETGPILAPISLSPVEKQPLVDELNAIETEILTLDRRMQTLEKRLGKPPYEGADVESRVNALRSAIDPPVRSGQSSTETYKPEPIDPNDRLLEVAKLKITLPSDALFSPGQSDLRDTPLKDQVLNQVLDQLVNYPQATIVVSSYSDDQAKRKDSQDYTLAQANALRDYLQASLPGRYRWVTVGGGQAQPVASNAKDTGRQQNRRIEIVVDTRSRR